MISTLQHALIIVATVVTTIVLMAGATMIGLVAVQFFRRRDARRLAASESELNEAAEGTPMLTIVWEQPDLETDGLSSTVTGNAHLYTQDADGRVISERSARALRTEIPFTVTDKVTELALVLHHGVPDSVGLVLENGGRQAIQLMPSYDID